MHSVTFTGPDGQRVSVHHLGGRGEPLLVAHAAGFCGGAYQPLADELTSRFEVWALDLRGHGDSPAPDGGDFAWDGMARDVRTAVAGLDRGPMAFVGHSLGGASGMRAEALWPGTLTGVYVYEPAVLPPLETIEGIAETSAMMAAMTRQRRAAWSSREEAVARLGARPPYAAICPAALRAYVRHGTRNGDGPTVWLKCDPEHEARVYEAPAKITVEQIAGIRVPVLVGMGERDPGLPSSAAPLITAAVPGARVESYPGLGHFGPLEDPALVAARAAEHLGGLPDGRCAGAVTSADTVGEG